MTDDARDLLAGEALGILASDERTAVQELVGRDRDAAVELEAHRATIAELESGVARTLPPDGLFGLVLAELEPSPIVAPPSPTPTPTPTPTPVPAARAPRRRWSFFPRLAAAGAVAVAVAVVGIALFGDDGIGRADARATVAGTPQFVGVSGEATLHSPDEASGLLVLDLENVPPPPSGHHYQVWVLRNEGGGAMEAVGSFTPADEQARLEFRLPGPGEYSAVDVSVEPDGGSPEHSSVSLAGGAFAS